MRRMICLAMALLVCASMCLTSFAAVNSPGQEGPAATGDSFSLVWWLLLLVIAAVAVVVLTVLYRRSAASQKD